MRMRIYRHGWKSPRYDGSKPEGSKESGDDIASESRAKEKAILGDSEHPSPVEKKVSRAERIQSLSLESEFDERLEEMDELIKRGVFILETPRVTREAALNTLTDEQLEMASEYHEPTLLVVPKTSLKAKAAALGTAVSIAQKQARQDIEGLSEAEESNAEEILKWNKPDMPEEFFKGDSGSEQIAGWEVRLVDGQTAWKTDSKKGYKENWVRSKLSRKEPLPSEIVKRLKWRHENGEREIDPHAYMMLAIVSLLRGEPIDNQESNPDIRAQFTVLEDELCDIADLKESSPDGFEELDVFNKELSNGVGEAADTEKKSAVACWSDTKHRFVFGFVKAGFDIKKRYRRSVGGEVKP